jgi:citrate lyase beta subunit
MRCTLTLFTADANQAASAQRAGIDRIGVDLESIGKAQRQAGLNTWLSPHCLDDALRLRHAVRSASFFARVNPVHDGTRSEVETLLALGVSTLMLPNFTSLDEVVQFLAIVADRASVVPLVERRAATCLIEDLARIGVREIHVGLNDLSIDLGVRNRLALLTSPLIDNLVQTARRCGMRVGVGGVGRADDVSLPIPSDLVYAQLARLGATGALISRAFVQSPMTEAELADEVRRLRQRLDEWGSASSDQWEQARAELARRTAELEVVG